MKAIVASSGTLAFFNAALTSSKSDVASDPPKEGRDILLIE
jgi:hypothetical protein